MPKVLPRYDQKFSREVSFALSYIQRLELAKTNLSVYRLNALTARDVEFSYELAFLRIFLAWEILLEESFLRFSCGYAHGGGQEPLAAGKTYHRNIVNAGSALLGKRKYVLWHNPADVLIRVRQIFYGSRYEMIVASAQTHLEKCAAIRHRIAHAQEHAQQQFDTVTMSLAGKRYPASRPGRFLRDWQPSSLPPKRWLSALSDDLISLALQICH